MALFYANENFPYRAVELLRAMGHDVLTTQDAGKAGQAIPDDSVLAYATQNNRAVLTLNRRDFIRLHQLNPGHAGIIVCKADADNAALANRIHEQVKQLESVAGQPLESTDPGAPDKPAHYRPNLSRTSRAARSPDCNAPSMYPVHSVAVSVPAQ